MESRKLDDSFHSVIMDRLHYAYQTKWEYGMLASGLAITNLFFILVGISDGGCTSYNHVHPCPVRRKKLRRRLENSKKLGIFPIEVKELYLVDEGRGRTINPVAAERVHIDSSTAC
jgi:hypothetical protein